MPFLLFFFFISIEINTGSSATQEETAGLFGLGKYAGVCPHTLNYNIRLSLLKLQLLFYNWDTVTRISTKSYTYKSFRGAIQHIKCFKSYRVKETHTHEQSKCSDQRNRYKNQGYHTRKGNTLLPTEHLVNTDFKDHCKFLEVLIKNRGKDWNIWIVFLSDSFSWFKKKKWYDLYM